MPRPAAAPQPSPRDLLFATWFARLFLGAASLKFLVALWRVFTGADPGVSDAALAGRVASALPTATVQTRDRFVREEAAIVGDMAADLM